MSSDHGATRATGIAYAVGGETFHAKDRPFYIERDGGRGEEVFFDISYSPVFELDGSIGGVLCIVSETTVRVLAERGDLASKQLLGDVLASSDSANRQEAIRLTWIVIIAVAIISLILAMIGLATLKVR